MAKMKRHWYVEWGGKPFGKHAISCRSKKSCHALAKKFKSGGLRNVKVKRTK